MLYTINELRKATFPKVYEVYEVFQNFFGDDFVDLQNLPEDDDIISNLANLDIYPEDDRINVDGHKLIRLKNLYAPVYCFILVYWPRVTVTNEHDKSVNIQELYAKITINVEGRIPYEYRGFQLNRSHYTIDQWMYGYSKNGYLHSHIPRIPKDDFTQFQNPCLGSGPINGTIGNLKNSFDALQWMLFCQELALYVTVESLSGGPYCHLEEIGSSKALSGYGNYTETDSKIPIEVTRFKSYFADYSDTFKDFIDYYLEKGNLAFSYRDGKFIPGMPYYDFIIDISNSFIDYFNAFYKGFNTRRLFTEGLMTEAIVSNGKFYQNTEAPIMEDTSQYEGELICTFKGREIRLSIDHNVEGFHPVVTLLLNHNLAMYILNNILKVINFRYKNEYISKKRGNAAESAPTYQNVRYL